MNDLPPDLGKPRRSIDWQLIAATAIGALTGTLTLALITAAVTITEALT